MVKEVKKQVQEVCLDPRYPCAREYENANRDEIVTVLDVSPSLYQMITTATVGSMPGNSPAYGYPDLGDDEEAHDHPDYEKLNQLDIVEKETYVENWLSKPEIYEKKKEESGTTVVTESQEGVEDDKGNAAAQ